MRKDLLIHCRWLEVLYKVIKLKRTSNSWFVTGQTKRVLYVVIALHYICYDHAIVYDTVTQFYSIGFPTSNSMWIRGNTEPQTTCQIVNSRRLVWLSLSTHTVPKKTFKWSWNGPLKKWKWNTCVFLGVGRCAGLGKTRIQNKTK